MKKVSLFLISVFFVSGLVFGQSKANNWKEMTEFETTMNTAFKNIKSNNLEPVRENVPQLYRQAKMWYSVAQVENRFSKPETMKTLESLMIRCNDLWAATNDKESNVKIKAIATDIQTMYRKVSADVKQ